MAEQFEENLRETYFFDKNNRALIDYTHSTVGSEREPVEQMILLYNRIRDEFRYDPFKIVFSAKEMRASALLPRDHGFCIDKALLLATCARVLSIPSRIGFADVRNHLTSPKFEELMGSNVFTYHGYADLNLEGKWVKATPAFNRELCQRSNVPPLEFNGRQDSIFQEFNSHNKKHMEYIHDRGTYDDLPLDEIVQSLKQCHPAFYVYLNRQNALKG